MKRLLLISYNFPPELTGIGKYNGEMIDWFVKRGYDCGVLTAYPYYPDWYVHDTYKPRRFWFSTERSTPEGANGSLTIYRCPLYVPAKPSGLKRIILDITFFVTALIRLLWLIPGKRYDMVITVAPSFQVGLLGLLYKIVRGARLAYHVQDLQIEAARDLGMIRQKFLIDFMFFIEKLILRRADVVSTISDGMAKKVKMKGGISPVLFPNWTNTMDLYPISDRQLVRSEFGFRDSEKIVLYSGAIGEKQGLEAILAAASANQRCSDLKFVICGDGPYKSKLEEAARQRGVSNVAFLPLQQPCRFNHFLNAADIHLIIQKAGASDLVMPSKLGGILAVGGLALVTANRGTSLCELVERHKMGYVIPAEDQQALDDAIAKLSSDDFQFMRKNARGYAEEFLSVDKVMSGFEEVLKYSCGEQVVSRPVEIGELVDQV